MKVDIEEYIQDEKHREKMDTATKPEKGHGRTETRTAFTTNDVSWMSGGREWPGLRCIGAIKTHFLPPLDKMRNNTVFFLMETILRHLWRQQQMKFSDFKRNGHIKMVVLSFLLVASFPPVPASAQMVKSGSGTDLKVRIPISAGWWSFTDEDCQETVTGIAGVRTGAELYPVREGKSPEDGVFRLYGRVMFDWRIGAGNQNTYKALCNVVGIQPQILARLNITRQHGVYLGAGPLWALELYTFEPKYGERTTVTRRGTAVSVTAGYSFKTKGRLSLFAELEYDRFITDGMPDVFAPSAGIAIEL